MQRFVEGIHPKIMPNPLIKDIARNIGKMHLLLLKSKFKVKRKSIHRYKKRDLGKYTDENIKEMQKELLINLKKFKSKKLKTARIHSDLSEINLIAKNNKLKAMIDWDDSDYDYLAYEIAIFIAHSFVRSKVIHKDKIKLFLKEYQKHIRLNDDEKRLVYYLIEYRLFGILYWNIKYIKLYPEKSKSLKRGIKRSAARLENFKKLSLEEFLEWFK